MPGRITSPVTETLRSTWYSPREGTNNRSPSASSKSALPVGFGITIASVSTCSSSRKRSRIARSGAAADLERAGMRHVTADEHLEDPQAHQSKLWLEPARTSAELLAQFLARLFEREPRHRNSPEVGDP